MTKASADTTAISSHQAAQVERANESGRIPVVFVHGLWLLPNSWQRWETLFGEAGYATVAPGWPDDPETVQEAKAHPEVFAHKTVTIDRSWQAVPEIALNFVSRFQPTTGGN